MNSYQASQNLRAEAELLRRANPEMDDDEKLFADMVEGCTNINELIGEYVREYFDKMAIADRLRERADLIENQALARKSWIKTLRGIGHITGRQTFPEGTVFETKKPDELIFDPEQVPDEYKKVDKIKLRAALNNKVTTYARLVPSNAPPTLTIKTR